MIVEIVRRYPDYSWDKNCHVIFLLAGRFPRAISRFWRYPKWNRLILEVARNDTYYRLNKI